MAVEEASGNRDTRRSLPSVARVLDTVEARALLADHPHALVVDAIRAELGAARSSMSHGAAPPEAGDVANAAGDRLQRADEGTLRPVINATGVVLHTNLGRAPLSEATIHAMERVARGYSTLEFDLEAGGRGSRHEHVSELLCRLTGAEAALIVNNNASAVMLALAALATGREVVIARGQLVEIGGGFRIPDVLRQSGAVLVEVGTTNRTYAADYAAAITDQTALLLRVHASNFQVIGFTHETSLSEMVGLAHSRGLLVVDDLGSGSLLPTERFGLAHEPMAQESVAAGADVVCFSGDKLLGGPQAGILIGRSESIARLRRHPLTRAVRPDKATLAGLCATLTHYVRGEAERDVPVWRMIAATREELAERAIRIVADAGADRAEIAEAESAVGGGSLPGMTIPSVAVAVSHESLAPVAIAEALRHWSTPIVAHIRHDRVMLDLRTIAPEQDPEVASAIRGISV